MRKYILTHMNIITYYGKLFQNRWNAINLSGIVKLLELVDGVFEKLCTEQINPDDVVERLVRLL